MLDRDTLHHTSIISTERGCVMARHTYPTRQPLVCFVKFIMLCGFSLPRTITTPPMAILGSAMKGFSAVVCTLPAANQRAANTRGNHVKDRPLIINAGKGKRKKRGATEAVRTSAAAQRRKAPSFFQRSASWLSQNNDNGPTGTSQSLHVVAELKAEKSGEW